MLARSATLDQTRPAPSRSGDGGLFSGRGGVPPFPWAKPSLALHPRAASARGAPAATPSPCTGTGAGAGERRTACSAVSVSRRAFDALAACVLPMPRQHAGMRPGCTCACLDSVDACWLGSRCLARLHAREWIGHACCPSTPSSKPYVTYLVCLQKANPIFCSPNAKLASAIAPFHCVCASPFWLAPVFFLPPLTAGAWSRGPTDQWG